ncbi:MULTISPECIES: hypothetical protein [unclassified Thermosipho (in: thermotogales)]|uniref:hypothetical protein n=1 Tax=unclassified Thermosipho (in: thermotogales) TaxID=2676525 RepID=UPI001E2E462A|nr:MULTISPECIES: hypothetical protein [unclassified Thermosipho (in: thermotogales)]
MANSLNYMLNNLKNLIKNIIDVSQAMYYSENDLATVSQEQTASAKELSPQV